MSQVNLFDSAPSDPARLTSRTWASWKRPPDVAAGWRPVWDQWAESAEAKVLAGRIDSALGSGEVVFPPVPWRALTLTDLADVRVVILGQDPYHGPGQAHGLAFSVEPGMAIPPSLRNIRAECQRTEAVNLPAHGSLFAWAQRGVLLINTCWTVTQGQAASHAKWGWESLTRAILEAVWSAQSPTVFMAWGGHAQQVMDELATRHLQGVSPRLILKANHPSPLSARRPPVPFLGCDHFRLAREWLLAQGLNWSWRFE